MEKSIVGVEISLDFGAQVANFTPTKVNGIALVNPQVVPMDFDQIIMLACSIQMRRIKEKQAGLTTDSIVIPGKKE